MLRKMMHFTRKDFELTDIFFERTERAISNAITCLNIVTWDKAAHLEVHHWAGWIANIANADPD